MRRLGKLFHHSRIGLTRVRVQILAGTLLTMFLILLATGVLTYHSISELIRDNTNRYVQNIVDQSVSRMDAIFSQVDTLTFQVTNDKRIQSVLFQNITGEQSSFERSLLAGRTLDEYMSNYASINALELYAGNQSIYPVSGQTLSSRIGTSWIEKADSGPAKLVWVGIDPVSPRYIVAVRSILLEQDGYERAGYLVVKIPKDLSNIMSSTLSGIEEGQAYLMNESGHIVLPGGRSDMLDPDKVYDVKAIKSLGQGRFLPVYQHSAISSWTMVVLVPLNKVSEGLDILKRALIGSGTLGILLAVFLSQTLSSLITRPVRKLMRAMRNTKHDIPVRNQEHYYTVEMNELNHTYNRMVERIENLVETVYEKELMKSQAEIRALQAQINPHFLYNTLEAFYWNLKETDQDELADKVIALSHIFRYTVQGKNSGDFVTVREEVQHVDQYMLLMLMRIGHRVTWEMKVDQRAAGVLMPKLILQPLVENAVQHGIEAGSGTGSIRLRIEHSENEVRIAVEDDGSGMDPLYLEKSDGRQDTPNGIALLNIHKRLIMLYGEEYGLQLESQAGHGTMIRLRIPAGGHKKWN